MSSDEYSQTLPEGSRTLLWQQDFMWCPELTSHEMVTLCHMEWHPKTAPMET
ncbi:hypothetical protein ACR4U3_004880 [Salmonella enterica]